MAKIFISFLGVGKYLGANYYYPTIDSKVQNIKYVQEGILRTICSDFSTNDKIVIFLTADAKKINWNPVDGEGLKSRLENLYSSGLRPEILPVENVPKGFLENEIWKLFKIVYEYIDFEDEVVLDITHGFRSTPMLAVVLLSYAKLLKKINVRGIYYGAFEVLGPGYQVKEIDVKDRDVPIVDLTGLMELQEWIVAARDLIERGHGERIKIILTDIHSEAYRKSRSYLPKQLSNVGKNIGNATKAISVVRPHEAMSEIGRFQMNIDGAFEDVKNLDEAIPFKSILNYIYEEYRPLDLGKEDFWSDKGFQSQKALLNYYIKVGLFQQAITFGRELLVSKVCKIQGLDYIEQRSEAEEILNELSKVEYSRDFFNENTLKIADCWRFLRDIRNDVNHAGMRKNPTPSKKLIGQIIQACEDVIEII